MFLTHEKNEWLMKSLNWYKIALTQLNKYNIEQNIENWAKWWFLKYQYLKWMVYKRKKTL